MHQSMHQHISMSIITMMQSFPVVIETIEKENTQDQIKLKIAFYFAWFLIFVPLIGLSENTLMDISNEK